MSVKQINLDPSYTKCANGETEKCAFQGTREVLYGKNGKYIAKSGTDGIQCNINTFGGVDPVVGSNKDCYVKMDKTYESCASENENCKFIGEQDVYYGADGQFGKKQGNNGLACSLATFGNMDPAPGAHKRCYIEKLPLLGAPQITPPNDKNNESNSDSKMKYYIIAAIISVIVLLIIIFICIYLYTRTPANIVEID